MNIKEIRACTRRVSQETEESISEKIQTNAKRGLSSLILDATTVSELLEELYRKQGYTVYRAWPARLHILWR